MAADGYQFFLSVNGVWLTKKVPSEYLIRLIDEKDVIEKEKSD